MVVLRGRSVDTSSQPNIDENVSELVEETIEEGSEGSLSEKDDSYGEHETAFEEPNNGDSQEDESVDVQGRSPSARKKRKVVSDTETENKCHIVSTGRFESSSSILFAKLHLGLDSVNVLLRTLFEEISVGKETHILRNLFSLILRVSFFPNASDWPESVQEQLDEFLSNWDFSDNSLENMLISLPEDMLHPKLCLNLKDKASKRFRSRYEAFWKNLAKIAPRSIIDNQSKLFYYCSVGPESRQVSLILLWTNWPCSLPQASGTFDMWHLYLVSPSATDSLVPKSRQGVNILYSKSMRLNPNPTNET